VNNTCRVNILKQYTIALNNAENINDDQINNRHFKQKTDKYYK